MSLIRDPKAELSAQVAEEQRRADNLHWRNRQSQAADEDGRKPTSRTRQVILWVVIALAVLSAISFVVLLTAGAHP